MRKCVMNTFLELDFVKKKKKSGVVFKLRKLRQTNVVPLPTTTIMQLEVVVQKIPTNTYKSTIGVSSLKFTYPTWNVDTFII